MSSEDSATGSDSGALIRKSQRNVDRIDASVSPSGSAEFSSARGESDDDDRVVSSSSRRSGQMTGQDSGSSEEDHLSISTRRRKKVETQSDLRTTRARKEQTEQERKRQVERERKAKRKEQLEALKSVPVFGLGPSLCPYIALGDHDDKPSTSTRDSVIQCGRGRNWPAINFVILGSESRP